MAKAQIDLMGVGGSGATVYRETISNTGSNHHLEYETKNAVGYIIAHDASSLFLAFTLENGTLTVDKSDGNYIIGCTYTSGVLSIDFVNTLWGNYFTICYE